MNQARKKLVEVALPLDAISEASAREKSLRHGHPSTIHQWWARRPLAVCRAVLFSQFVDDPSAWPDRFPSEEEQNRERRRLFHVIEELVKWENSNDPRVLNAAQLEIARSIARARVADGESDHRDEEILDEAVSPVAVRSYLSEAAPPVYDPFAGGGSIPLEAQRLGLRAIGADLNPVAVLISKALVEIPSKFAGKAPVGWESETAGSRDSRLGSWSAASGLAEDVRRYGSWIRDQAFARIGKLYPQAELPAEHGGGKATAIAWIWARTIESPNPAFRGVHVPLISSFFLSKKKGAETWLEPVIEGKSFRFRVRTGKPSDLDGVRAGTKTGRGTFRCLLSDVPISNDYIRERAMDGGLGVCLLAVVAEGNRRRIYLEATKEAADIAASATPAWRPESEIADNPRILAPPLYGMKEWADVFTSRQLAALATFSELVADAKEKVVADAQAAGWDDDGLGIEAGGCGATAYGDALAIYLTLAVGKASDYWSTLCLWHNGGAHQKITNTFSRQAVAMTWDYAEGNPFSRSSGHYYRYVELIANVLDKLPALQPGIVTQRDATTPALAGSPTSGGAVISTDPPYYDNVGYADLSDYFYVWIRRCMRPVLPDLFSTLLVPKADELVASPYRHGGKIEAEKFFLEGIRRAIRTITAETTAGAPICLYYAFRQSETTTEGTSSTGWETFLRGLIDIGLVIVGTWPARTELTTSLKKGTNALASSIVLVCRRRPDDAPTITRGDFRRVLKLELPQSLSTLQKGNIAPVDLAQASIGPGMGIFSRYTSVLEADGAAMTVRSALQLIHQVSDEVRGEEEGELDSDTRFAVTWFESHGFERGPYGDAETLAKARAVSVSGVESAGLVKAAAGSVRLYRRDELPSDWDPETDDRLTVWEATQQLIKRLEGGGEVAAAALLPKLGTLGEQARDLSYRLYSTCERKGWADEAKVYNGLVLAWSDLEKLAGSSEAIAGPEPQAELFE